MNIVTLALCTSTLALVSIAPDTLKYFRVATSLHGIPDFDAGVKDTKQVPNSYWANLFGGSVANILGVYKARSSYRRTSKDMTVPIICYTTSTLATRSTRKVTVIIALCAFKLALKREWREHELGYELGQTQGTITTLKKDSAFRET